MRKMLQELSDNNVAVIEEMWRIASEKNTVEISQVTRITFPTDEFITNFHKEVQAMDEDEVQQDTFDYKQYAMSKRRRLDD